QKISNLAPVIDGPIGGISTQGVAPTADAAQSATEAVVSAAKTIGISLTADDLTLKESDPSGSRFVFANSAFTEDIKVESVYFPVEQGSITKSWSMVLWEDNPAFYTIVSANDGALLWRKNITNDQTQSVTYSFYDGDSPAPLSPTSVTVPGSGFQAPGINRTSLTLISELPAFDNLGWITDGGNVTTGNNVDAGLDIVSPN